MSSTRSPRRKRPFNVGLTGHRPNRMPERHWDRVRKDLDDVLAMLEESHPGRQRVLMSGLAEGADRLAAFVALGRGWSLRAVLAFHRTRFEKDFPEPSSIGEFRALLAAADRIDEPKKSAYRSQPAEDAYQAVGQVLLARSDALIAIWDGQASQGKGGTVEVIEAARLKAIPIIWIHARTRQKPRQLLEHD